MKSVIDKIRKRRFYPVELSSGESVHVRPLGWEDRVAMDAFDKTEDRIAYALGTCLLDDNGNRAFPIADGESVIDYLVRFRAEIIDATYEDVNRIMSAIAKVTKTPSEESLEKN